MNLKRHLRVALAIAAFSVSVFPSFAQTIITVGTGTTTIAPNQYPAPYGNFYWGARHQFIIQAAELNAAGMTSAGDLNSLAFDVDVANGVSLTNFTISLKNTSSLSVGANFETGATVVYGPQNFTENTGWNTHTFAAPFYWDGVSNLLVETCFNNGAWSGNARVRYTSTAFNSAGYFRADNPGVCAQTNATQSNNRPNMRFDWNPGNIPPDADFYASTLSTCDGFVDFFDNSQFNPTSWQWDFGDANTSTAQNPSHVYTSSGVYTVQLIACNANGCDTLTQVAYINVNLGGAGPIPASCTPTTLTYCCGFGITNVTFNSINNNSSDGIAGYEDFTCQQTTVIGGTSYTLDIATPNPTTHNAAAWIDYNNDGSFNNTTERVLTSTSQLQHTGNFTIPGTAVLNTPLRMRVAADYDFSAALSACGDVEFGQVEDYTIIVQANTAAPTPDFTVSDTITCTGTVNFTDLTTGLPTGWLWDFGDTNISNQQNAIHTYTASGTYTVTLTASNANGSNSITYTALVTVNLSGALTPAACTPTTLSYCCGYGIFNVNFNTIDFDSPDGVEGYRDNSCTQATSVTEGQSYPISIKTGQSANQDTKVWIDFNNDGVLDNVTELVFSGLNTIDPAGTLTIPGGTSIGVPVRMRVSSDFVGSTLNSCSNNTWGQTEDYAVTILQNLTPPTANFTADSTTNCAGTVNFTDLSTNGPTTWLWDFGDSNTSTQQHPTHTYATPGTYTVSLTASNANGSDAFTQTSYITYDPGVCQVYNMPFFGTTTVTSCVGTLYDTGGPTNNYNSNTDGSFVIQPAGAVQISLSFSFFDLVASFGGDTIYVYDGPSAASPLLGAYSGNPLPNGGAPIISSGGSMTVRQVTDNNTTDPGFECSWSCTPGVPLPPVANFSASQTDICITQCVVFTDLSTSTAGGVTSWSWALNGSTTPTSTAQNPTACYNTPGSYDVTLTVTDQNGTHDTTFVGYINVTNGTSCDTILVADFTASETVVCEGECIAFTDNSFSNSGGVTTWQWAFPGGTPSSSTSQNPTVCYNTPGTYDVTLMVTDVNGTHDTVMVDMIEVNGANACDTAVMPSNGIGTTLTSCSGTLADDGGTSANYSDNSDGTITIAPTNSNGDPIRIVFSSFSFEENFDYLYIYDGPSAASPLIGQFDGTALPNGGTITSTGGSITLKQTSDFAINEAGFVLTWSCLTSIDAPIGMFDMNVYPNPTHSDFTIDFTIPTVQEEMQLNITNALGQQILAENVKNQASFTRKIETSAMQPGIYFITLTYNSGQIVRRVIVE